MKRQAFIHIVKSLEKPTAQVKTCQRVCLNLTHGQKESTGIQHCIKSIADEVANSRFVQLINFGCNRTDNRPEIRYCSYS